MDNNDNEKEKMNLRNVTKWYVEKGHEFDYVPMEKRDSEQTRALLLKAEDDLKSAKREYKHKSFNNSITYTQQTVEKTGKSILIATGLSTTKDLKQISHRFSIYLIKKIESFYKSFSGYDENELDSKILTKIKSFFETYKEKRMSFSLVQNIDELRNYLESYEIVFTFVMGLIETLDKAEIQLPILTEYRDSFETILEEVEKISNRTLTSEEKENYIQDYYQFFIEQDMLLQLTNTVGISILLFFLAILSMNLDIHFERSRYPEKKDDFYTNEDEIVQVLPEMIKTVDSIIEKYYYILSINNEPEKNSEL